MSTMLKRKIDEQNRLWNRMQEIQDAAESEGRDWTAEERTNWDAANAKIDEVSSDIERLERSLQLSEVDYRQVVSDSGEPEDRKDAVEDHAERYEEAFNAYMRGGLEKLTVEQRQLMMAESRETPQITTTPNLGGYLVPAGFRNTMTEALKAFGGLINHANVFTTSTGNSLSWPTSDETSAKGAILAETNPGTVIPDQNVTFGTKSIGAYTYTSKLVRVSWQLLQDNAFNLDTWLPRKLGERIGRAVADDLITGTGTGMPTGILSTAGGITNGATIGLANFNGGGGGAGVHPGYDAIINLEHSVDPAYRASGDCRFLFNDTTLASLRKYKDADGRPLWLPVPVSGVPATINGRPYTIDQGMPTAANPGKPVLFGNFAAAYLVRQVLDVTAVRLNERYADYLQTGFFAFMRMDATTDDTNAVKALAINAA